MAYSRIEPAHIVFEVTDTNNRTIVLTVDAEEARQLVGELSASIGAILKMQQKS